MVSRGCLMWMHVSGMFGRTPAVEAGVLGSPHLSLEDLRCRHPASANLVVGSGVCQSVGPKGEISVG